MSGEISLKTSRLVIIYEVMMIILALIVVVILAIEHLATLSQAQIEWLVRIDATILGIFVLDYLIRFIRAPGKWEFIKSNPFDLIAIIPLDKTFRLARLARLVRLTRLSKASKMTRVLKMTKLVRVAALGVRFKEKLFGILKTNGLNYVLTVTGGFILMGGVAIYYVEPNIVKISDGIWWSIVTATTVGYGDISPETIGGRVVASLLMIIGISLIGMVTGSIATYFVKENNSSIRDISLEDLIAELERRKKMMEVS